MAYSACSLVPPGSGRQNQSSCSHPFLTRFLSGRHISAVFASFSGFSPPFGSLVAYPVGEGGPSMGALGSCIAAEAGAAGNGALLWPWLLVPRGERLPQDRASGREKAAGLRPP